jgi:hypothetical protein
MRCIRNTIDGNLRPAIVPGSLGLLTNNLDHVLDVHKLSENIGASGESD